MIFEDMACCGMRELTGVTHFETKDDLIEAFEDQNEHCRINHITFSKVVFSDVLKGNNGAKKLAAYLTRNDLGTVIYCGARENPNTGNTIRVFVWTINRKNVAKFLKKHINPEERYL